MTDVGLHDTDEGNVEFVGFLEFQLIDYANNPLIYTACLHGKLPLLNIFLFSVELRHTSVE